MTIELAPQLELRLRATAAQEGLSVEEYLAAMLDKAAKTPDSSAPANAADCDSRTEDGSESGDPESRELTAQFEEWAEASGGESAPSDTAEILRYWQRTGVFESAPPGPDSPELARQWRDGSAEERRRRLFGKSS